MKIERLHLVIKLSTFEIWPSECLLNVLKCLLIPRFVYHIVSQFIMKDCLP